MIVLRFLVSLRRNTWFGHNKVRQLPIAILIGIFIVETSSQKKCTRTSLCLKAEHLAL